VNFKGEGVCTGATNGAAEPSCGCGVRRDATNPPTTTAATATTVTVINRTFRTP
jgi:hypothetical protein